MKRLFIVIPPVILFAVFVFFYKAHVAEKEHAAAVSAEKARQESIKEEARKKALQEEAERLAAIEKAKRQDEIEKALEKIKNEKEEKYRKLIADTEAANASSKKLQAQIVKLQADILAVRAARDNAQAEAMKTKLDLEQARIDKRNAEFEIQRFTDMLANRMDQTQALVNDVLAGAKKK